MATEKQSHKFVALLVEHQGDFEKWPKDVLQSAISNPREAIRLFGEYLAKIELGAEMKVKSILRVLKNGIRVDSVPSVKTNDCFKKGFAYRDSDIDSWMAKQTSIVDSGSVICYELTEDGSTFFDMAHVILETGSEQSEEKIAKLLIEQGKTFSPKQVEDLHKRFVAGETEIGFNTNGYANFFFVHDEDGRVFVLDVRLGSDGWSVDVFNLGFSNGWDRGDRLFSRN